MPEVPDPPAEAGCAECGTSLREGQDRETTEDGAFCRPCFNNLTHQLQQVARIQGEGINYSLALVGGLAGGALGAGAWWGFTVLTEVAFGLIAILIGIAVGKGVVLATGGKRARNLQFLSVGISIVSFFCATYLVTRTFIERAYAEQGLTLPLLPDAQTFFDVVRAGFGIMDVVFLAIVVYQAWKIPAPFEFAPRGTS